MLVPEGAIKKGGLENWGRLDGLRDDGGVAVFLENVDFFSSTPSTRLWSLLMLL